MSLSLSRAANGAVIVFVLTFVGLGLNYIYGVVLARWLGAADYGLYSLGLTLFNILALLSVSGVDSSVLRFLPKYKKFFGSIDESILVKSSLIFVVFISLPISLLLYLYSDLVSIGVFQREELIEILKVFSLIIPAFALTNVMMSVMQARHQVLLRMVVKYVSEPVIKFILTLVFLYLGMGLMGALSGFFVASWISVLICFYVLRRDLFSFSASNRAGYIVTYNRIVFFVAPLMLGMLFNVVASKSDILLIGYFLTNTDVGIYAVSFQTAAIILIILQSLETVLAPHLSEAVTNKNIDDLKVYYQLSLRWMLLLGSPLFVVFIVFSEEILRIYGEDYVVGAYVFMLLSVSSFINLSTGSANYILLFLGKSRTVMLNQFASGIVQIVFGVILIQEFALLGAAFAAISSVFLINLLRLIQVYKLTGIQPYEKFQAKAVISAAIMCLFLIFVSSPNDGIVMLVYIILSFFVYGTSLFLMGMHNDDMSIVRSYYTKFIGR